MTPFAWAPKEAAAAAEGPGEPTDRIQPYRLPFDGHRPVLVCGAEYSRKETFVQQLLRSERPTGTVHVLDPSGTTDYQVPGHVVITHRPADVEDDGLYFTRAVSLLDEALDTSGNALVIDEFLLMTRPYDPPLPEQAEFLAALDKAMTNARRNRARLIMVSTLAPDRTYLPRFGCRFAIGPVLPMDWAMLFGRAAAEVQTTNRPGTGVLHLDGHFEAIEFPLVEAAAPKPEKPSRFKRAKPAVVADTPTKESGSKRGLRSRDPQPRVSI